MGWWPRRAAAALALAAASAGSARATLRIFSYDPADAGTRHAAGALTFEFNQALTSTTVLRLLATEGDAGAGVKRADPRVLGPGGLDKAVGSGLVARDLYEVEPGDDGAALISAFCPGSQRAWMAFSKIKFNRDLTIHVLGDGEGAGAHLCLTLRFSFHGEWRLPPGSRFDPALLTRHNSPIGADR